MKFFRKKELRVILWSFGCEGKTSLLYKGLKGMNDIQLIPTITFNIENIVFNGLNISFWDVGGADKIKEIRRRSFLPLGDVIIYLIDSSQPLIEDNYSDFKYNFEELKKCIEIIEDKPLLIAITKIDIRKVSTLDIINAYKLENLFQRKQKFGIIECSAVTSEGIKEIQYWLSSIKI